MEYFTLCAKLFVVAVWFLDSAHIQVQEHVSNRS